MADPFPTLRQRAQQYTGSNDPASDQYQEDWIVGPYNKYIANPYREFKRERIQNAYNIVMDATGDQERAIREANAVARKYSRGETILETAAILGIPGGQIKAIERGAELARGAMRGRNAMTAEEMLPRALPPPRPGPSSPVGRGVTGEPIPGTSAERAPRLPYQEYKPDVRSVPDEYAMFEGEGGLTSDAIAEARRLARERIAAERAFRERQLATMEGEGGGAQAAGEARARAAAADRAAMEAAINAAESEGMGAAIGAGRRAPETGRSLVPVGGRDVVPMGGRDVVPARTASTDLEALMNRHFGGGETSGLPARGPTYYSNYPDAGPRLVGESRYTGPAGMTIEEWMAANPGRTNLPSNGMPAWLKYGTPAGAALAGGTYLASGKGPSDGAAPASTPWPVSFDDLTQVPEMPREQAAPKLASDILRGYGMNAFTKPAATTSGAGGAGQVPPPPQRPQRQERGFLDRILSQPTQSKGGELIQDGRINWGSGESAADFVRASQAMRKMQDEGTKFEDIRGINPDLEGRKSGGKVDEDKSLKKALEIIHHLVKR